MVERAAPLTTNNLERFSEEDWDDLVSESKGNISHVLL